MTDRAAPSATDPFAAVQALILQHAKRGADQLAVHTQGHLRAAVRSLTAAKGTHIVIVTGFFIGNQADGHPETDGPIGAAQLGHFLQLAGWQVTLITDQNCAAAVQCARDVLHAQFNVRILSTLDDISQLRSAWDQGINAPSHIIAVERAGPAADGAPHNMRGVDISATTAPLHELFAGKAAIPTITIADGVNEIGMGVMPASAVAELGPIDATIHCTIKVDHVVLAGVSNWGAVGFAAAATLLDPALQQDLNAVFDPTVGDAIAQALCDGQIAVDGVTNTFTTETVDGISAKIGHSVTKSVLAVAIAVQKLD